MNEHTRAGSGSLTVEPTKHCSLDLLLQYRRELAAFQTVSCSLQHEQVVDILDECSTKQNDLDTLRVKRRGFCQMDARRKWLGCAHSRSNDTFARIADSVYEAGVLPFDRRPSDIVNLLAVQIYMLDQEKGLMEKKLAVSLGLYNAGDIESARVIIADIQHRHKGIIEKLEQYRLTILAELDHAINVYQAAVADGAQIESLSFPRLYTGR